MKSPIRPVREYTDWRVWNCRSPLPTFGTHWRGESRPRNCRPRSPATFAITVCTRRLARGYLNPNARRVHPAVRHHCDLTVLREAHHIHDEIAPAQHGSSGFGRLGQEDLRHAVAAREVEQRYRGILALQDTGLDAHAAREFEV